MALVAALQLVPVGSATHLADVRLTLPPALDVPESPIASPGIPPVDRRVGEVSGVLHDANETLEERYETVNQTYRGADRSRPSQPLQIYFDGAGQTETGPDASIGGQRDWRVMGDAAWTRSSTAARTGNVGLAMERRPDGTYAGALHGMLLSPALDVASGFADPALRSSYNLLAPAIGNLDSTIQSGVGDEHLSAKNLLTVSGVYSALWYELHYRVFTGPEASACGGEGHPCWSTGLRAEDPGDALYQLEFWARFNLAQGEDFVQTYVFTGAEPPKEAPTPLTCPTMSAPSCTRVYPAEGYSRGGPTSVADPSEAFTGTGGWEAYHLDLTSWAETSQPVWVGFVVDTANYASPKRFQNPALFAEGVGFFGFQIDDLRLTVPSPPGNVRVRVPHEPSFKFVGQSEPSVRPNETFFVAGDIVNTGQNTVAVRPTVIVREVVNRTVVFEEKLPRSDLTPGALLHIVKSIGGLPEGQYLVRILAGRMPSGQPLGNPEADTSDDLATLVFRVQEISNVEFGPLLLPAKTMNRGDTLSVATTVTNHGTEPTTVTLVADVVNVPDRTLVPDSAGMIVTNQQIQTQVIPSLGSADFRWDVKGTTVGQFRLFVREATATAFRPSDLEDPLRPTIRPQFRPDERPLDLPDPSDSFFASRDLWLNVQSIPIPIPIEDTKARMSLQAINSNSTLFMAVTHHEDCNPSCRNWFAKAAYFDDGADAVAVDGEEDGFTATSSMLNHKRWNGTTLQWDSDGLASGWISTKTDAGLKETVAVFARPINSTGQGELRSGPGEMVGFLLQMQGDTIVYPYPSGATTVDGDSFVPANKDISDEMAAWARIELSEYGDEAPSGRRFLSGSFGVDKAAPAIYAADFSDCASTVGWGSSDRQRPGYVYDKPWITNVDAWNCAPYSPDGQVHMFSGQRPGTCMAGERCDPFTIADPDPGGGNQVKRARLYSPPITIGADSAPYLHILHEYGSKMGVDRRGTPIGDPERYFTTPQNYRVALQILDPATNAWGPSIILEPQGGYDTEITAGVYDPLAGPRQVSGSLYDIYDRSSECTTLTASVNQERLSNLNPRCGWWTPTGAQPFQKFTGQAMQGRLYNGSGWQRDVVPLFGQPFGDPTLVDVAGKTIRLEFIAALRGGPTPPYDVPTPEHGWRIGGIVIAEEGTGIRDLAVRNVTLGPTPYNATVLGLGAGTLAPVKVTVANVGKVKEPSIAVVVRGTDVASGELLCKSFTGSAIPLEPGQTREVSVPCPLPSAPGVGVRFSAAVAAAVADDFPPDNVRSTREFYRLRSSPSLGIILDSSARTGRAQTDRQIDLVVANTGNQPVSGFSIRRTIEYRADDGENQLLDADVWHFQGTLGVGERHGLLDVALQPADVIGPEETHFNPPLPGFYEVVATVDHEADQNLADNAARLALHADDELYADDFDNPRTADPGIVPAGSTPIGSNPPWATANAGFLGTKALLAGDPSTGEIAAQTDATYTLPLMHLATAKSVSLALSHRYDLEAAYDGGRVELSVDGGTTWRPLVPNPNALAGRPSGYPDIPIVGLSSLTADDSSQAALAFTGSSVDFADAVDGWTRLVFDLGQAPELRRPAEFEHFDLAGFQPSPTLVTERDGQLQRRHESWELDEPGAFANERYWWVENIAPRPVSGTNMWWSGSFGETPGTPVNTKLSLNMSTPLPAASDERPLFLRWWDWRTGGIDSLDPLGVAGGNLKVTIFEPDTDNDGLPNWVELRTTGTNWQDADTDDDGFEDGVEIHSGKNPLDASSQPTLRPNSGGLTEEWVARMAAVGQGLNQAEMDNGNPDNDGLINRLEMEWGTLPKTQDSDGDGVHDGPEVTQGTNPTFAHEAVQTEFVREDGWALQRLNVSRSWGAVLAEFAYISDTSTFADRRLNLGVFIDDVQVLQSDVSPFGELVDPSVLGHDDLEADGGENWTVTATGTAKWSIVESELAQRDPGWRVGSDVSVPGLGPSVPWHFTAANEQGYPHRVDARLVTPVVDLRSVRSNDATLRFDHQYDFETTTTPHSRGCTSGCFTIAVDGGAVEYQVQDPNTEEFGPWLQLGAGELPEGLLFLRQGATGMDRFWDETQAERFRQSGYTALSLREPRRDSMVNDCDHGAASFGYSFQRFVGYASRSGGCPWLERPYSMVFSGSSGGWRHEEWSIAQLAGYKVRFAFHVATNPGHVTEGYTRLGWQVANVAVAGSVFSGRDAQIRFRVGTDASITKGSWVIDDISIVGDLYERLAVLEPSSPNLAKAPPESFVDFFANITNYGRDPRSNLILAIGGLPPSQFDVISPAPGTSTVPSPELPVGFSVGFGPVQLFGGGQPGSRVPVHVRVRGPAENGVASLRLALLEHNGTAYATPANDVPGTVSDVWRVEGFTSTLLAAVPPSPAEPALIRMEPRTAAVGAAVTFTSRIQNSGSTQPVVAAAWALEEIQGKGNPDDQPKTRETKVPEASHVDDLGTIRPLESRQSKATFAPQKAGLYRVTVRFLADGQPSGGSESIEFLVGIPGNYHLTDFAVDNATARGWRDDSPSPEERSGGTPPELRFRQAGTQFLWGVSDDQLRQSYDYCSFGGCNFPVQSQASTVAGLEGIGKGPIIDLSRVPGDEATLSIRHGFAFTSPGDGGRLEVLPYDPDTLDTPFPAPAFFCEDAQGNQFPERFILEPEDPLQGLATSTNAGARRLSGSNSYVPQRINALAGPPPVNVPVFGGPVVVEQTDRYPLSQTPTPACDNPLFEPGEGFNLLNYPIQLVLHTGTQAGVNPGQGVQNMQRTGSVGWRIFAVSVSSVDLDVEPRELRIPLIDGIQKDFQIRITNRGQVADRLQVTVDPSRTTLPNPSWVQVPSPEVELGPGESAQVPYRLEIPTAEALSRGTYVASLLVRSLVDPNAYQHVTNTILLLPNPLPDLGLTLALGSTDIEGTVEEGMVIPVFATVFNQGLADAAAVRLTLSVHDIVDGTDIDLGSVDVPELCADARARSGLCAGPSTAPLFFEWPTPLKSGPYRLTARLDPDGRLNEESVDNNVATLDATVVPIRRPDIAIQTITIDAGPDGIADEGELLKLTATLRNLGSASASGVNVQISMGSTPLLDRRFDVVPAQFSINLTATVLAPAGDFVVKAITFTDSAGLPDANPSNNEFKRILRVRSHELLAEASASVTGLPGQTVQARVTLTNTGNTLEDVVGGLDPALASQGWTIGLAPMPFLLPPGSTADAAVSLRIPDNASAGVHRVTVRFSDQRSQQPLADAIILADILRIEAEPTIALVNATIAPGQHALRFVAKSHSNANENVTLRLMTPAWGDRSNRTLLPAHDNVTIGLKVDIPGTAPPGLHNLSVQLVGDGARVLARAVLPLRIEPKLGSSFRWVSGERVDAAEPGNQVLRLEATVENTGNVPFSFELVSPIPGSSPATGYLETVPLEPGAARRTTWNLPLPAHIDAHALEPVQALVHFQTNKTALAAVLPIPSLETLANLVATEPIVRPQEGLRPRDPLNVDFLVGNRGARATAGGRVLAYIDGVLADMAPLPPIGAGQEHATTFHWSAPGPGDHLLLFVVEATNQTPESTVADNSASLPIHVGEAAPLDKVLHAVPNAATPTLLAAIAAAAFIAHRRRRG